MYAAYHIGARSGASPGGGDGRGGCHSAALLLQAPHRTLCQDGSNKEGLCSL